MYHYTWLKVPIYCFAKEFMNSTSVLVGRPVK